MIVWVALLGLLAAGSRSRKPKADPEALRAEALSSALCSLVGDGVPSESLLELALVAIYRAKPWPSGEVWSDAQIAALQKFDREIVAAAQTFIDAEIRSDAFLSKCTYTKSPYASGRLEHVGAFGWRPRLQWDARVTGAPAANVSASFDRARAAIFESVHYFGAPAFEGDRFVEAIAKQGTSNRLSIWVAPDGSYRVVSIRGTNPPTHRAFQRLDEARGQADLL